MRFAANNFLDPKIAMRRQSRSAWNRFYAHVRITFLQQAVKILSHLCTTTQVLNKLPALNNFEDNWPIRTYVVKYLEGTRYHYRKKGSENENDEVCVYSLRLPSFLTPQCRNLSLLLSSVKLSSPARYFFNSHVISHAAHKIFACFLQKRRHVVDHVEVLAPSNKIFKRSNFDRQASSDVAPDPPVTHKSTQAACSQSTVTVTTSDSKSKDSEDDTPTSKSEGRDVTTFIPKPGDTPTPNLEDEIASIYKPIDTPTSEADATTSIYQPIDTPTSEADATTSISKPIDTPTSNSQADDVSTSNPKASDSAEASVSAESSSFLETLHKLEMLPYEQYCICTEKDFENMLDWDADQRLNHFFLLALANKIRPAQLTGLVSAFQKFGNQEKDM